MTASLAAVAAFLLSLCFPPGPVPMPSLWGFLAVVTVLAVSDGGRVPFGCLGLPGEPTPQTGDVP